MKKIQAGFTLIELMIVIAVLGILASIAIAAYTDYTIRSKISEAVNSANVFVTAYGSYYYTEGVLPTSRTELGHGDIITKYIEGVTITAAGQISIDVNEISTGIAEAVPGEDMYVIFQPTLVTGAIDFSCYANNAVDGTGDSFNLSRFMPANCR